MPVAEVTLSLPEGDHVFEIRFKAGKCDYGVEGSPVWDEAEIQDIESITCDVNAEAYVENNIGEFEEQIETKCLEHYNGH